MNVQIRVHILRTFVTHLLIHIRQKKKIVLEIAAKIASVNRPLYYCTNPIYHCTNGYGVSMNKILEIDGKICFAKMSIPVATAIKFHMVYR
jgi:hypothetical protein